MCVCSLVALTATPHHGSATGNLCLVSVHTVLGLHATVYTLYVSVMCFSDLRVFPVCLASEIIFVYKCSFSVSRILHLCFQSKARSACEIV